MTRWHADLAHLSWWQWFLLWADEDSTQLGMELTTYYMLCALMGSLQALAYARALGCLIGR